MQETELDLTQTEYGGSGFRTVGPCLHVGFTDRALSSLPVWMGFRPLLRDFIPNPGVRRSGIHRQRVGVVANDCVDGNKACLVVDPARHGDTFGLECVGPRDREAP